MEALPDNLALPNLEFFDVSHNAIKGLPDVGNMQKLVSLDVGHNLLTTIPDTVSQLVSLARLSVIHFIRTMQGVGLFLPPLWLFACVCMGMRGGLAPARQLSHDPYVQLTPVSTSRRTLVNNNIVTVPPEANALIENRGAALNVIMGQNPSVCLPSPNASGRYTLLCQCAAGTVGLTNCTSVRSLVTLDQAFASLRGAVHVTWPNSRLPGVRFAQDVVTQATSCTGGNVPNQVLRYTYRVGVKGPESTLLLLEARHTGSCGHTANPAWDTPARALLEGFAMQGSSTITVPVELVNSAFEMPDDFPSTQIPLLRTELNRTTSLPISQAAMKLPHEVKVNRYCPYHPTFRVQLPAASRRVINVGANPAGGIATISLGQQGLVVDPSPVNLQVPEWEHESFTVKVQGDELTVARADVEGGAWSQSLQLVAMESKQFECQSAVVVEADEQTGQVVLTVKSGVAVESTECTLELWADVLEMHESMHVSTFQVEVMDCWHRCGDHGTCDEGTGTR